MSDLRAEGSDVADVEVKRAAREFPRSVAETLSAFANTPGGGLIVFGLDEGSGFAAGGVYDPATCKAALASMARQAPAGDGTTIVVITHDRDVAAAMDRHIQIRDGRIIRDTPAST